MLSQDDISRRRRLNNGECPEHGQRMVQVGNDYNGDALMHCPMLDECDFTVVAVYGGKIWKSFIGDDEPIIIIEHPNEELWLSARGPSPWVRDMNNAILYQDEHAAEDVATEFDGVPVQMPKSLYDELCNVTRGRR